MSATTAAATTADETATTAAATTADECHYCCSYYC